ncbi:ATP-dependent DNA helicase PIF1 [Scleroderma yunnanense]
MNQELLVYYSIAIPSVESLHLGRASASGPTGVDDPEALFIPLSPTQTPPPLSPSPAIILSPEQQKVLTKVERGENVFFTGSAGTGKSVLLREIIRVRGGRGNVRLAITASTGIAGVNISGTTIHSWAGIGLGQEDAKKLAGKFLGQPKFERVRDRWRDVKTLIIDEISMIDGVLFDKLEYIARILRNDDSPFGGIQLVISGDFCQLPPVPDRDKNGVTVPALFAFEATSWKRCIPRPMVLTKVFRQKEQAFVDMLNLLRWGNLDNEVIRTFKSLARPVHYTDGIGPTELYPTRAEVERANTWKLDALDGAGSRYDATDTPGIDSYGERVTIMQMERLLDRLVAPRSVLLKVGAQVMLIKNLVQGHLVNGSVGQVVGFSTPQEASRNSTDIGTEEGMKGNKAEAMTRYSDAKWPVVRFTNGRELLCVPADFTVNNAIGEMEARRRQVPLILAWALSVHKSQGQTLERVKVDLARTFEKGQAYVALSRATSLDTLEVYSFHPSKIMVHPRVLDWHEDIEREEIMTGVHDSDEDCSDEMDMDQAMEVYWSQ